MRFEKALEALEVTRDRPFDRRLKKWRGQAEEPAGLTLDGLCLAEWLAGAGADYAVFV